jgi:hypothetical protein
VSGQGEPDPPHVGQLDDEVLWRLYAHAVDEYRFQVNLNWQRLQYFLGLNVAILGVGAGLLRLGSNRQPQLDNTLPALVFCAGVCLSLASWYLARRQQAYYRAARDNMTRIAQRLRVGDLGVATTAGARGERRPWWTKVRTVNELVLVALAALNGFGAVYALLN